MEPHPNGKPPIMTNFGRPTIVCLCGSTRFGQAFQEANLRETLAGRIVLSIGCNMKSDSEIFGQLTSKEQIEIKCELDELHKRKIDLADEILVLNVGGYVGDSTASEIEYAWVRQKPVRWLERSSIPQPFLNRAYIASDSEKCKCNPFGAMFHSCLIHGRAALLK